MGKFHPHDTKHASSVSADRSSNLRKVSLLLQAFEQAAKQIDYYALDLSRDELQRTLAELPAFEHVTCRGLWGTYDDGREWLGRVDERPKCIIHLGSSIGAQLSLSLSL